MIEGMKLPSAAALTLASLVAFATCGLVACGKSNPEAAKEAADTPKAKEDREMATLVASAQSSVTGALRDPDSARFRKSAVATATLESGKTNQVVCGYVNAKNGYGGYSGEQLWYVFRLWDGSTGVCVNGIKECDYKVLAAVNAVNACRDSLGP